MTKMNYQIFCLFSIAVFTIVFPLSFSLLNYLTTPSSSPKVCLKQNDRNEQFKLIWSDEFEGSGLNVTDWIVHDDTDTCENQSSCDRSENVQTLNGLLIVRTMNKKYNGRNYTGAKITTKQYFSRGRYEIRLVQPRGLALKPCIYTLNSNDKHKFDSGQIVLTCLSKSFYRNVYFAKEGNHTVNVAQYPTFQNERNQFHLYGFEWNEREVRFFYDQEYGDPILLNETKFIKPGQQLRFLIKTIKSQLKVSTDLDWKCPAFLIDYVRIYEKISNRNSTNETLDKCQNADRNYSKSEIDQICAKITNSEKLEKGQTENNQDKPKAEYNLKNYIQDLYHKNRTFFSLITGLIVFFLAFIIYLNYQICAIKRDRRNESNSPEPVYESIIYNL